MAPRNASNRMAALLAVMLATTLVVVVAQPQPSFIDSMKLTRGISESCTAAIAKITATSEYAKQMEIFSGRPKQALTVLIPAMLADIRGAKDEATGIGKFLYRPQIWSRGAPDSCLYLDETKFCNIDLLRRTSSWGVCIPEGCTESDVRKTLLPSPLFDELSSQVDIMCLTQSQARATTGVGAYLALGVTLALLVVAATSAWLLKGETELVPPSLATIESAVSYILRPLYALRRQIQESFSGDSARNLGQQVLKCFSLSDSWASLVAPPRQSAYLCLEAVRVLSFLWIILGHVMYFVGLGINWTNQRDALGFYGRGFLATVPGLIAAGFYFAVDTFLFISAFLAINSVLRQIKDKNMDTMTFIKEIPRSYLKRYLRLTPAYAMTIYVFIYVAPIMVEGVRRPEFLVFCDNCKTRAWENFLYINNILSDQPTPMCYPVSWFLALLFQFQLLGPWVGLMAAKSPRIAVLVLGIVCVASWGYSAYLTDKRGFRLNPMDTRTGYDHWANEWYTKPWTRAPSYIIGCLFAMLWYYKGKAIKAKLDQHAALRIATMATAIIFFGLTVLGAKAERPNVPGPWSMMERQLYIALSSSGWCLGFGALLSLLFSGSTWGLRELLEHPTWSFYGRLAYGMYLLHAAVLGIVTGSQGEPWHFTKMLLLVVFAGVTGVTFLGSLPLYLLVERPFTALAELLLKDREATKTVAGSTSAGSSKGAILPTKKTEIVTIRSSPKEETKADSGAH